MSFDPASAVLLEEDAPAFDPTASVPLTEFDVSSAVPIDDPAPPAAVPSALPEPDPNVVSGIETAAKEQAATKEGIFPEGSNPWKTIDGKLYIDPARYNLAVEQMWKFGVIDSSGYTSLLKGTVDQYDEASDSYIPSVEKATAARRDLERRAGAFPEAKAAASGLLKGAMQTGAAIVAGPAVAAATIPTGPGAVVAGIAGGAGAAILTGAAYDKALEASAKESDLLDSFYAANQLKPGYNSAGQLVSILAPTPVSVSRLANAANLIRTEKGGAEATKFIAGVLGTGAAIGVGTDVAIQAANMGLDKLIHPEINSLFAAEQYRQTGQQPHQRPEYDPSSTGVAGIIGGLSAGIGVKARNRVYFAAELPLVEQKVKLGTATREEAADYFSMRRTVEILREDQRLLDAGAIARSTVDFMGNRVLDTNTLINPRFQRDILTQAGFEPPVPAAQPTSRAAIPYAAENPQAAIPIQGQPPAYTGQTFLNTGGAAPAFQGGSNALPGPDGIAALPAPPAAVNPQVNLPVVSNDTFDPSTAVEITPTASAAPTVSAPTAPELTGSPELISGEGTSVTMPLLMRGDKFTDESGQEFQVWKNRQGTIESHPIIDGKVVVNNESGVRFSVTDEAAARNPNDRILSPNATTAPAVAGSPEQSGAGASVSPKPAPPRRFARLSYDAGSFPILAALQESPVRTSTSGKAGGENDIWDQMRRTGRHFAETHRKTGTPYDVRAQELYDQGLLTEPTADALASAYLGEIKSYRAVKDGDPQEQEYNKLQKQYDTFAKTAIAPPKSKQSNLQPISSSDLQVGDKVKIGDEWMHVKGIDPDTFSMSLQDGTKFGLQTVEDGTQMWVQETELAAPAQDDPFSFLDETDTPPAAPQQGDPFSGNLFTPTEMPFSLDRPLEDDNLKRQREADEAKRSQATYDEAQKGQGRMAFADQGPQSAPAPQTFTPPKQSTYTDAQVYADYPDAVGVMRAANGAWTMPVILGGTDKVPAMEMPELMEVFKSLSGNTPVIKKLSASLGLFHPSGKGKITLHPKLFIDEASAMMTFAHEIGHFVDFMDDRSMTKGNVLGIIAGLSKHLKHHIPLDPNAQAVEGWGFSGLPITGKERAGIRAQAEEDLTKSLEGEIRRVIVEEPIYAQSGITADTIKGLFGMDAREQMPELYKWFAEQDADTKKSIARQAMKGIVDSRMDSMQVQGEQIGTNTREEMQNVGGRAPTPEEFRAAIDNAMRAEMQARNVADLKFVREELIDLSKWWKPYDRSKSEDSHVRYRESAPELYADAISVLFNSPADLQNRAPAFWTTFWNYMDARPEVKAKLMQVQARILEGRDAVLDKRLARDLESFKSGAELFLSKQAAAQARRASLTGWWDNLKDQYWDKYQPLIDSAAKARSEGKISKAKEDGIRWLTEEHPLADSKLQLKLADIGRLYQSLDAAGVPRENFGLWLKHHRIANERIEIMREIDGQMQVVGETGRATLANPGGETSRTSAEMLEKLRSNLGPDKSAALEGAVSGFRDVVFSIMEDANSSGLFSPDLWDTISRNKDNYAAFTPLEYVEEYLPSTIRKQVGTFKEIADPLQQTILKAISIHRAAQNNRFKRAAVQAIREVAPELVKPAPMKYNGKTMVPTPTSETGRSLVQWKEDGQLTGVHLPDRYARMWEDKSPAERDAILRLLSTGFQKLVYGAIIRYNPAFQLFMSPARDLQRSLTNMPGGIKGRSLFLMRLMDPETWAASADWAKGDIGKTNLMREMIQNAATGGPHSAFGGKMGSADDSIDGILHKFHLQDKHSRNVFVRSVMAPLKAIEFAGQVLGMLPKASAYKVMVKDMGVPAPAAANTIRNHIGIPNYHKKGRHVSSAGALVPFLNIFLRSYDSLQRNLRGAESNMNAKEWWIAWLFAGGGIMAVMQTLAKEGVLGEDLRKLYSRVPEWDMTNFAVLPLGEVPTGDTGGKTVYARLPQDEGLRVINGIVGKILSSAIRTAKGDPTAPQIGDVFAGISSQVPGTNTLVEAAQNWSTFLAGRNPRDSFRNRNILSDDQWLAGGWEATKPMLGWTLGASGITNFFNYDIEADNLTELSISATPVLNRLIKISDRGVYQNQAKVEEADKRDMANVRLSLPDQVNGLRTEYNYLKGRGENRSERESLRYYDLGQWYRSYRKAMDEVETSKELGNRYEAQSAVRMLIDESKFYRQR